MKTAGLGWTGIALAFRGSYCDDIFSAHGLVLIGVLGKICTTHSKIRSIMLKHY
jgi:hypothetical protein